MGLGGWHIVKSLVSIDYSKTSFVQNAEVVPPQPNPTAEGKGSVLCYFNEPCYKIPASCTIHKMPGKSNGDWQKV